MFRFEAVKIVANLFRNEDGCDGASINDKDEFIDFVDAIYQYIVEGKKGNQNG